MDIKKTLSVVNIILDLEEQYNIQWLFQNVNSYFDQKNTEQIKITKADIYEYIKGSEIWNFVNTDIKILKFIWIYWFFDESVINEFEWILKSGYEIKTDLNWFISKRNEKLQHLKNLKNSLDGLWVEVLDEDVNRYQIVYSFPEQYHDLHELEKVSHDIRMLLNYVDAKSSEQKWYKISSVNNGCIEFFIECSKFLVRNYTIIIDWFIRFYSLVKAFEDGKKLYSSYSSERKKAAEDIAKEELGEKKKELLWEFVSSLEIDDLTDEDKTKISKLFVALSKHIEKWVYTEVKTPILDEPQKEDIENMEEDEKEQYEASVKNFEFKKQVDENNKKLFELQQENIQLQLPEFVEEE